MHKITRIAFAAASSLIVCATANAFPRTPDRGTEPPYCLQGSTYGYPGYCEFWNYQQCKATASGTMDACGINPRHALSTRVPLAR
jgi:hypothetical protein